MHHGYQTGWRRTTVAIVAVACSVLAGCGGKRAATPQGSTSGEAPTPTVAASSGQAALPSNLVQWTEGETYQIGQAVHDPQSGAIVQVNGVRVDDTLPGLETGKEWVLVDMTLGNTGQSTLSVYPLGDLGIQVEGSTKYIIEPTFAGEELEGKAGGTPMVNTDIAPGQAFRGLLAVQAPMSAKGMVLWYAPGVMVENPRPDTPRIAVSLGR